VAGDGAARWRTGSPRSTAAFEELRNWSEEIFVMGLPWELPGAGVAELRGPEVSGWSGQPLGDRGHQAVRPRPAAQAVHSLAEGIASDIKKEQAAELGYNRAWCSGQAAATLPGLSGDQGTSGDVTQPVLPTQQRHHSSARPA